MRIHNQPCDRLCDGNQMGNRLPSERQRENLKVSRSNWVMSYRNCENRGFSPYANFITANFITAIFQKSP